MDCEAVMRGMGGIIVVNGGRPVTVRIAPDGWHHVFDNKTGEKIVEIPPGAGRLEGPWDAGAADPVRERMLARGHGKAERARELAARLKFTSELTVTEPPKAEPNPVAASKAGQGPPCMTPGCSAAALFSPLTKTFAWAHAGWCEEHARQAHEATTEPFTQHLVRARLDRELAAKLQPAAPGVDIRAGGTTGVVGEAKREPKWAEDIKCWGWCEMPSSGFQVRVETKRFEGLLFATTPEIEAALRATPEVRAVGNTCRVALNDAGDTVVAIEGL